MTRFLMSLSEAVELVMFAYEHAEAGDILVQKAPACTIGDLALALKEIFKSKSQIKIIGIRHGEKLHETLLTKEEHVRSIEIENFYRVPADKRSLNYEKYMDYGDCKLLKAKDFSSNSTYLLNIDEIKDILLKQDYIKKYL